LVQILSTTKLHNALAVHIILYGSEIWNIRKKDKKTIGIDRDQICQTNSRYTLLGHNRNEEILEHLEVELVNKKLGRYKSNWLQHVTRMDRNRMAKIVLNCRLSG
jgi:hypothetical protein